MLRSEGHGAPKVHKKLPHQQLFELIADAQRLLTSFIFAEDGLQLTQRKSNVNKSKKIICEHSARTTSSSSSRLCGDSWNDDHAEAKLVAIWC